MDFFNLPPFKPHCFTLAVWVRLCRLGTHEFISFVPAPFPPVQVTLRDLKSISGFLWFFFFFFCQGSWLKPLTAEEVAQKEGGSWRMLPGTRRCCGDKEPVGLCCGPLSSWKERHPGVWRVGMRGQGPLSLLNLVNRVWGEGQINSMNVELRSFSIAPLQLCFRGAPRTSLCLSFGDTTFSLPLLGTSSFLKYSVHWVKSVSQKRKNIIWHSLCMESKKK